MNIIRDENVLPGVHKMVKVFSNVFGQIIKGLIEKKKKNS